LADLAKLTACFPVKKVIKELSPKITGGFPVNYYSGKPACMKEFYILDKN